MKKNEWKRRLLAGLLCTAMLFQNLSVTASAAPGGAEDAAVQETEETVPEDAEGGVEASTAPDDLPDATKTEPEDAPEPAQTQETATESEESSEPQENAGESGQADEETETEPDNSDNTDSMGDALGGSDTDPVTIKMGDAGSVTVTDTDKKTVEIKEVDRNNAKWVELKVSEAGDYHIYTTNSGTNADGDPMVVIYDIDKKPDKVVRDEVLNGTAANIVVKDNDNGHAYKNFYGGIHFDGAGSCFILAGSRSSKTDEQTSFTLHIEKAGAKKVEAVTLAADNTASITDVSEYQYQWIKFRAPADGIYYFETTGDNNADGLLELFADQNKETEHLATASARTVPVTMMKDTNIYIQAYAVSDKDTGGGNDQRKAYDTVSFDVKAVTAAKADSFLLSFKDITTGSAAYTAAYVGDIPLTGTYRVAYKKHSEEAYTDWKETNNRSLKGEPYTDSLTDLEPNTAYDVKLSVRTDTALQKSNEEGAEKAEIIITGSFTTKAEKPADYTYKGLKAGPYTLDVAVDTYMGGFKITGLKAVKGDEEGTATVTASMKKKDPETEAFEPLSSATVTLGEDEIVDISADRLYMGESYLIQFKVDGNDTDAPIEIQAGAYPSALSPAVKQGYESIVLDFTDVPVKPSNVALGLDEAPATVTGSLSDKVYVNKTIKKDIKDEENHGLVLAVKITEGGQERIGLKKLDTQVKAWTTDDIKVEVGSPTYNDEEFGLNVPVTVSDPTDTAANLAVTASFTVKGKAAVTSSYTKVGADGKATAVIPCLDAGAEGTITVDVYEDLYQGTKKKLEEDDYTWLASDTPTETGADGSEVEKTYTVEDSKLYTVDCNVPDPAGVDSAPCTVKVSKLRLGGSVKATIEYASETKADADNGIEGKSAEANLTDGNGIKRLESIFSFDEGKDPVAQKKVIEDLDAGCEYAYRIKLYGTDKNNKQFLLMTTAIKTFKTIPVSDIRIEQSVGKITYETVELKAKFNITADPGKAVIKYRRLKDGETPAEWEVTPSINTFGRDRIDETLLTAKFNIEGLVPGEKYEWRVTGYNKEDIAETAIKGDTRFTVPKPELSVAVKPGRYDATFTLSSKDIMDYMEAAGKNLTLYYTDDTAIDLGAVNADTDWTNKDVTERLIAVGAFNKNSYTQLQEAEVLTKDDGILKADTAYRYAVYIINNDTYICLKSGDFRTGVALSESGFGISKTGQTDGYAKYSMVFDYGKAPEGIDIETTVHTSDRDDVFQYGTLTDGTTPVKGKAYAKGLVVRAKKTVKGTDTDTVTYISKNIDLTETITGVTVDTVTHTIALNVTPVTIESWLGQTGNFRQLSEIYVQPYITFLGGGTVNDTTKNYELQDIIVKAETQSVSFKQLKDAKVDITSVNVVNTSENGVELIVEGQVSPVYVADDKIYAFAGYYTTLDDPDTKDKNEYDGKYTSTVEVDTAGKFTLKAQGLEYALKDYVPKYRVEVYIVTEDRTDFRTASNAIDVESYRNCSGKKEYPNTVETKEDFVHAEVNTVTDQTAELLIWSRNGANSGFTVAVAEKEANPALYESDTADDFNEAVDKYKTNPDWKDWKAYGIDASNDAFLRGATISISGEKPQNKDYVYAIAKKNADGKFVRIAGGTFKTKEYGEVNPGPIGYKFYKGPVTHETALFYATIAPKYLTNTNYTIKLTYYIKGEENKKDSKSVVYNGPQEKILLEKLKPDTDYIVEKIEILDKDSKLLDTYVSEELNFKTDPKPKDGTYVEGSGKMELVDGTLRTGGFRVKTEFTFQDNKAVSPLNVAVYEGTAVVYTKRDIAKGDPSPKTVEQAGDDGTKLCTFYTYTLDDKNSNIAFRGLKPNTAYTVKAEMVIDNVNTVLAETVITTLEDTEYDLNGDTVIKDASLRKHVIAELEKKHVDMPGNKVRRSAIEAANITAFTVGKDEISHDTPPVASLEGIEILGQLEKLTITHQDLADADAAGKLVALTDLTLSFNNLTGVPDLTGCKKLTDLDISYNKIADAEFDSVQEGAVYHYQNRNIAHIHTEIKWAGQRAKDYSLSVEGFATIAGIGVDPKVEASVSGYRTDRAYKAVLSVDNAAVDTLYIPVLADPKKPEESAFKALLNKPVGLSAGAHTMKVTITSEEAYNFGAVIAEPEGSFTIGEPIAMEDETLKAAIKKLCTEKGNEKAVSDIETLELVKGAADTPITSLKGIEALAGLRTLIVRGHAITDAGSIAKLKKIEKIDLSRNKIENVADPEGPAELDLPELTYLDLSYNMLTSIPNLEKCNKMVANAGGNLVLDYRWNYIESPEEVFIRTNYRIPEYFRYQNGWLAKQAMCQRGEEDRNDLLLEITDSTFAAIGEKLNSRIVVDGLEFGTDSTKNTFKMVIKEGDKEIGQAVGEYIKETEENPYPCHSFKFTDLKLSDGEHTLTFEIYSDKKHNYGTIGTVEKKVTVRRNVIKDEALRKYLTEETVVDNTDYITIADIYGRTIQTIKLGNIPDKYKQLAIDEIKEFSYEGLCGDNRREPVRSLEGIKYMTALTKMDLAGNELDNTGITELTQLEGIAPDPDKGEKDKAKVDLSFNNLTAAPEEGIDADITYNRIEDESDETQRVYAVKSELVYYTVSELGTAPIYIEVDGLKIPDGQKGNDLNNKYRTYRFTLSEGTNVIATVDRKDEAEEAADNAYRKAGAAAKRGVYIADTKLKAGPHTLKLTVTDDLGESYDFGEFTVTIADPMVTAYIQTDTAAPLPQDGLTTDNRIVIQLSAPYLRVDEGFKKLTLKDATDTVIGTYTDAGNDAYFDPKKDPKPVTYEKELLYFSPLAKNMPGAMKNVKKTQFSGTVNIITPLQDGSVYTVVVETTAGRILTASGVRFGLDGRRRIIDTGFLGGVGTPAVLLNENYDSMGDYIYIWVTGVGLDFSRITPVLYSRKHTELTDTETVEMVHARQTSGNNEGAAVYKLTKIHKPIWEGDQLDVLGTDADGLYTTGATGTRLGIAYEIRYDAEEYPLEDGSNIEGFITGYEQADQSISVAGFTVHSAVFNYMTGQLEVDFGEKASSDPIQLSLTYTDTSNTVQVITLDATAADESPVANKMAYYDLSTCNIRATTPTALYNATFTNSYDNNVTRIYQVAFPVDYIGVPRNDTLTTWGSITTYAIAEGGEQEEESYFPEGTRKIGYKVTLHSDLYNHLNSYRLQLNGTGEKMADGTYRLNVIDTKAITFSAPDENGDMTAEGIFELKDPLTVGGNTQNTVTDAKGVTKYFDDYTIKLQSLNRDSGAYQDVNMLVTDADDTKNVNKPNPDGTAQIPIECRVFVYAPYAKTGKVLASNVILDTKKKTMTVITNNADELDTSGFSAGLTYMDQTSENKPVSDVAVERNYVVLGLSDILTDKACWVDVVYDKKRLYYQYSPEQLYGESKGENGHDAYYNIHESFKFLVDDYGGCYGYESSEGIAELTISSVTELDFTEIKLTSPDPVYEFEAKDLKGVDFTRVYCLRAKDNAGNIRIWQGNIAISPNKAKIPKSIKLSKATAKLNTVTADTLQLTATVSDGDKEIVWRSSTPAAATVDQNGLVRAVAANALAVKIEAVSRYDGSVRGSCEVEVHSFSINANGTLRVGTPPTLPTGGGVQTLATPLHLETEKDLKEELTIASTWDGAAADYVKYTTADTSVISINDNVVTPVGVGRALIKAEKDGYTAYADVSVTLNIKGGIMTFDEDGPGGKDPRDVESAVLLNGRGTENDYLLDWQPSPAGIGKGGCIAYFTSSNPDLVAVEEYTKGSFHLVPIAPTTDPVTITCTITKNDAAAGNKFNETIIATDTMTVTVLSNLEYPDDLYEALEAVTVYTDIAANKKGGMLTLGDVQLPEGWRWTDDTATVLYEGTVTNFNAIYEPEGLEGYAPIERTREGGNAITVYVGTGETPEVTERHDRRVITRVADKKKGGLDLRVQGDYNSEVNPNELHFTLAATNETGLEITWDETADPRANPERFYVEAGTAEAGEQTVSVSATYECEWIYPKEENKADPAKKKYVVWNSDTVYTQELTYKVVEGRVVDTVRLVRTNAEGKTTLLSPKGYDDIIKTTTQTLAAGAQYTYTITAYDQWGDQIDGAAFTWSCSDEEVLSISADGASAEVTASADGGKVTLTYTAEDDGAYTNEMTIWAVNAMPHVEGDKATVNTAVDYDNEPQLGDTISVIPAYAESLAGTPVITTDNGDDAAVSDTFELYCVQNPNGNGSGGRVQRELYSVIPRKGVEAGKSDSGNYYIRTATDAGYYFSPLKITVTEKKPSVTIKQTDKVNLFYKNDTGVISITVKGATGDDINLVNKKGERIFIESWSSAPKANEAGFVLISPTSKEAVKGGTEYKVTIRQQAIELDAKNKLADNSLTKGTLTIRIPGYKDPITKNFTIGTIYKAPVYTFYGTPDLNEWDLEDYTAKGSVNVCPDIGWPGGRTLVKVTAADLEDVKDVLAQKYAAGDARTTQNMATLYDYITWKNKNISVQVWHNTTNTADLTDYLFIKTTAKKSISDTVEFHSSQWRGTAKTKIKVNFVKPQLVLSRPTITVNKNYTGETYDYVAPNGNYTTQYALKNFAVGVAPKNVSIKGDKKAQALLDSGVLQITNNTDGKGNLTNSISVSLSKDEALRQTLKPGSYKFTVTPYFEPWNGTDKTLKAFKSTALTVKVVEKAADAKVSVKGKLDLLKVYGYDHTAEEIRRNGGTAQEISYLKYLIKDSYVELTAKFTNIDIKNDPIRQKPDGTGIDIRLIGEYADQFEVVTLTEHLPKENADHYLIRRSANSYTANGKLRAKENYKLRAVYTLSSGIELTSNVFSIKPIQSVPKITMDIKKAQLYASSTGAADNGIAVQITVPEGYGYNYAQSVSNRINNGAGADDARNRAAEDLLDNGILNITYRDKIFNSKEEEKDRDFNLITNNARNANGNFILVEDTAVNNIINRGVTYDRDTGMTTLHYKFNIRNDRGQFIKTTSKPKGLAGKFTFNYELYGRDRKAKDASSTIALTVNR